MHLRQPYGALQKSCRRIAHCIQGMMTAWSCHIGPARNLSALNAGHGRLENRSLQHLGCAPEVGLISLRGRELLVTRLA